MVNDDDLGHLGVTNDRSNYKSLLLGAVVYGFYSYGDVLYGNYPILGWCVFLLFVFLGSLYQNQSQLLYAPCPMGLSRRMTENPDGYRSPKEYNINYEEVWLKSPIDSVQLHAWLLLYANKHDNGNSSSNVSSKKVPTVMYFHGNAGNIGTRLPFFVKLMNEVKVNILAVEYRGYGHCTGTPSEEGISLDSQLLFNYLISRDDIIDTNNIIVFGRSLGGSVATCMLYSLKQYQQVKGLIIENAFSSVQDIALTLFPLLKAVKPIIPFLLKNKWETSRKIIDINIPILFMSAKNDELVPPTHMQNMFVRASLNPECGKKHDFILFEDSSHNDIPIVEPEKYYKVWSQFLSKL